MTVLSINELTTSRIDFGTLRPPSGKTVHFVTLHLGFQNQGTAGTCPPLHMTPDQARTLAMGLLAAADKAPTSGSTDGCQSSH